MCVGAPVAAWGTRTLPTSEWSGFSVDLIRNISEECGFASKLELRLPGQNGTAPTAGDFANSRDFRMAERDAYERMHFVLQL